jgi:hypothetical protein
VEKNKADAEAAPALPSDPAATGAVSIVDLAQEPRALAKAERRAKRAKRREEKQARRDERRARRRKTDGDDGRKSRMV